MAVPAPPHSVTDAAILASTETSPKSSHALVCMFEVLQYSYILTLHTLQCFLRLVHSCEHVQFHLIDILHLYAESAVPLSSWPLQCLGVITDEERNNWLKTVYEELRKFLVFTSHQVN